MGGSGFGLSILSVLTTVSVVITGFTFVDDTDLLVAMHSKVDFDHGIETMDEWFDLHKDKDDLPPAFPRDKILEGIDIVMRNNMLSFGDDYFAQRNSTVMGTSAACAGATIYCTYHEELKLLQPLHQIMFYRRLIDDALIIQNGAPGACANFMQAMNAFGEPRGPLEWEVTEASDNVDFLDFAIILHQGQTETRTFQKAINLCLYHPPILHSTP
jgi:hypothetical protein